VLQMKQIGSVFDHVLSSVGGETAAHPLPSAGLVHADSIHGCVAVCAEQRRRQQLHERDAHCVCRRHQVDTTLRH